LLGLHTRDILLHPRVVMMLAADYVLMGGRDFLQSESNKLAELLSLTVTKVQPRGAEYVALVLEALLRAFPLEGGLLLMESQVIPTMLKSCASHYLEDDNSEPRRVVNLYLTSICRSLLGNRTLLDAFFASVDTSSFGPRELVVMILQCARANALDSFHPTRRKLCLMALLAQIQQNQQQTCLSPFVLQQARGLSEECQNNACNEEECSFYSVGFDFDEESLPDRQHDEDPFIKQAVANDIANTTNFPQLVRYNLTELQRLMGENLLSHKFANNNALEPSSLQMSFTK